MSRTEREMIAELYDDEVCRLAKENSDEMLKIIALDESISSVYKLEPNSIKPSGFTYDGGGILHDKEFELKQKFLEKNKSDAINPSHYKHGHIETIDYMRAISTHEEYRGHLRLTAIKYLSRLGKKDKSSQEVGKAIWYLEKLKTALEEYEAFMMDGEAE